MITKYVGLTDEELLAHVQQARRASPVIEELAQRLELRLAGEPEDDSFSLLPCPACEAPLKVAYSSDAHQYTLGLDQ